jgi:hypothetical protein
MALLARVAAREAQARGGNPLLAAAVAGGLIATATTMAFGAVAGLETGLWGLLFCCALDRGWVAAVHERPSSAIACGVALGLLGWTRPEGVLVGGLAIGLFALRRELWPQALRIALVFGGLVAVLCGFRLIVYGALVPNTFHAKPPDPMKGLVYLRTFWVYGLGIVGPLAMIPAMRRNRFARALILLCGVMILGTVWSGGDWMTGFRRLTVPTFGIYLLMGVGASLAFASQSAAAYRMRVVAIAGVAAVLVGHGYTATSVVQRRIQPSHLKRIAVLAESSPEVSQVALVDIGIFGWYFRGSILDLVGLTDAHIGRLPGTHGHKEWDEAYFREREPELVLVMSSGSWEAPLGEAFHVRPFELGVLRSIVIEGGYRYYSSHVLESDRRLMVLVRDDVRLDSTLWGPADARDPLAELRSFRERRLREGAAQSS